MCERPWHRWTESDSIPLAFSLPDCGLIWEATAEVVQLQGATKEATLWDDR